MNVHNKCSYLMTVWFFVLLCLNVDRCYPDKTSRFAVMFKPSGRIIRRFNRRINISDRSSQLLQYSHSFWRKLSRLSASGMAVNFTLLMDRFTPVTTDFSPPNNLEKSPELDRSKFQKSVIVPSVIVPQTNLNDAGKKLKKFLMKIPKMAPIQDHSSMEKLVLLNPAFVRGPNDCDQDFLRVVSDIVIFDKAYRACELRLTYENWNADDVLKVLLPEGESISGFSIVGHIVHFNLRPCHQPYKRLIGQVILDKLKNVRTVVNKTDTIDNVYRIFKMELLSGDDDTIVTVKENGCRFNLDFANVYWNSRLGTEHERIIEKVKKGDLVYDVFAGVGPFAVPCARKGATVFANDLNPESYKWLNENVTLNTSRKYPTNKYIQTYNMDGRYFIQQVVSDDLKRRKDFQGKIHILMNLPAIAVEFLDAFVNLYQTSESVPDSWVHCYAFSRIENYYSDSFADVRYRTETALGCKLPSDYLIRLVRNVSPNKDMLCVSFRLTRAGFT